MGVQILDGFQHNGTLGQDLAFRTFPAEHPAHGQNQNLH